MPEPGHRGSGEKIVWPGQVQRDAAGGVTWDGHDTGTAPEIQFVVGVEKTIHPTHGP